MPSVGRKVPVLSTGGVATTYMPCVSIFFIADKIFKRFGVIPLFARLCMGTGGPVQVEAASGSHGRQRAGGGRLGL